MINFLKTHMLTLFVLVLAVVVISFATLIYVYNTTGFYHKQEAKPQTQEEKLVKKDVPTNIVPNNFPADVPIEQGAKITQNYNATTSDGRFQATRAFETSKAMKDNITLYKDFLTRAGYKLGASIDQDNYKMISGVKDNERLQISVDQNQASKITTVSINYTQVK